MSSKPLLTEQMVSLINITSLSQIFQITQKIVADVNKERARIEREKKRMEVRPHFLLFYSDHRIYH